MAHKRLFSLALAAVLAFPLSAFAENRSHSRTTVDTEGVEITNSSTLSVDALVAAMNRERIARGLRRLRVNHALSLAASDRLRDMLAQHYFNHVSPTGLDPFTWVDKRGYDYTEIGENLAVGYATADDVVDGWMHSPGHRDNILRSAFAEVGIAFTDASPLRPYRGPLVVVLYGAH
jgi:uncharacterized protein YkwD